MSAEDQDLWSKIRTAPTQELIETYRKRYPPRWLGLGDTGPFPRDVGEAERKLRDGPRDEADFRQLTSQVQALLPRWPDTAQAYRFYDRAMDREKNSRILRGCWIPPPSNTCIETDDSFIERRKSYLRLLKEILQAARQEQNLRTSRESTAPLLCSEVPTFIEAALESLVHAESLELRVILSDTSPNESNDRELSATMDTIITRMIAPLYADFAHVSWLKSGDRFQPSPNATVLYAQYQSARSGSYQSEGGGTTVRGFVITTSLALFPSGARIPALEREITAYPASTVRWSQSSPLSQVEEHLWGSAMASFKTQLAATMFCERAMQGLLQYN